MAKLKRWTTTVLLILLGLVFGLLVLEIGLRIAGISYLSFMSVDDHTGVAFRSGVEGWYRKEGEAYVRISSDGLRDREHSKAKPANTMRIAVLGDSFASALEVPIENTFWSIMEKELEECEALSGQEVEVINLGVYGYGTTQELVSLQQRAWNYDPDLVLLAFFTGNDISDNSRALNQDPLKPYFIYRRGEIVLDSSFLESAKYRARQTWYAQLGYRVINTLRVLQLVNEAKRTLDQYRIAQRRDSASDGEFNKTSLDIQIYHDPENLDWKNAWRVTEELIRMIREEVMDKGADFLVVTLSNPIQVHPDPYVRKEFIESEGIQDLFYPDLRIKALGEQEGFSVLNLAQPFQAYAEKSGIFLHGFENATLGEGHWNTEGHHLAGQLISQKICQRLHEDS